MTQATRKASHGWRAIAAVVLAGVVVLAGIAVPRWWLASRVEPNQADAAAQLTGLDPAWKPWVERTLVAVALIGLAVGLGVGWRRSRHLPPAEPTPELLRAAAGLTLPFGCRLVLLRVDGRPFLAGIDPTGLKSFLPLPIPANRTDAAESTGTTTATLGILEVRA